MGRKEREKLSIRETTRIFARSKNTLYKCRKKIEPIEENKQRVIKIDMEILRRDIEESADAY